MDGHLILGENLCQLLFSVKAEIFTEASYFSLFIDHIICSMTFGAILAATDPVAVAVLLNELGAPPRLKVRLINVKSCIQPTIHK